MQIKITNEQHFQVLADQFTIGISESGYTLMFSADGFNFSPMFTVNANTNRLVTNVSNGTYYYLAGNEGDVIVNYMTDCGTGGGGSTAGVSSINGMTGAVNLKTINGTEVTGDGNINIEGGSSNYNLVDDLPVGIGRGRAMGTPNEEGQMVWLNTEYEDVEATTIHMIAEQMGWEHIGTFRRTDGIELFPLGASRNEGEEAAYFMVFGEGFVDDGSWRIKMFNIDGVDYIFHYSWVNGSRDFSYFWDNDDVVFEWQERIVEAGWFSTTEDTITRKVREGAQYIYSDEYGWMRNVYDLDSMNDEQRIALAREAAGYINNKQKPFPYPIIWRYGDKCYRSVTVGACFDGTENDSISVWAFNGDNKAVIRAFTSADGTLNYEEYPIASSPRVFYLYENMDEYDYMEAFNQILYNSDENGMYRGDATFYMKDPYFNGRIRATHIVKFGDNRMMLGGMFEANGSIYWAQVNLWHNEGEPYSYEYSEKTIGS